MAITGFSSRRSAAAIISIMITASLSLATNTAVASAAHDGYAGVLTDHFLGLNPRSGSRFLAGNGKGDNCNPAAGKSGCPGGQLCCNNQCREVAGDKNNCGACGNKCGFGQLCCGGSCTVVAYDVNNCGTCGTVCKPGVRCEYGTCGYA